LWNPLFKKLHILEHLLYHVVAQVLASLEVECAHTVARGFPVTPRTLSAKVLGVGSQLGDGVELGRNGVRQTLQRVVVGAQFGVQLEELGNRNEGQSNIVPTRNTVNNPLHTVETNVHGFNRVAYGNIDVYRTRRWPAIKCGVQWDGTLRVVDGTETHCVLLAGGTLLR
jgi:hypothetical protein